MNPLFETKTLPQKSSLYSIKIYIILLIIVSLQISICVWVGRVQQNANETKQSLLNLQNLYHLRRDVVPKIQEVIVVGPSEEFNLEAINFQETVSVWKVVKKAGLISLHSKAYLEVYVEGFYQVTAQLRLSDDFNVPEYISYHLKKNDETVASTTWSSKKSTSAINVVTYGKKGDRLSLYIPWKGVKWFVSKEVTYFSAYYIGS